MQDVFCVNFDILNGYMSYFVVLSMLEMCDVLLKKNYPT